MEQWWNDTDGKTEIPEKNLFQCLFAHHMYMQITVQGHLLCSIALIYISGNGFGEEIFLDIFPTRTLPSLSRRQYQLF
jgi:hypothetical protein